MIPALRRIGARAVAGWFPTLPASRLGWIRGIMGLFLVTTLVQQRADWLSLGASDPGLFAPVGVVRLLGGPLPPATLPLIQGGTVALAALWALGLGWRLVGPTFAAAFLFWASYRLSWGFMAHGTHLLALHVLVMAFTPAAAAVSADAALARRWPRWPACIPGPVQGSERYGWPLRLLSAVTTLTYLLAGLAKVSQPGGMGWARGYNLRDQVAYAVMTHNLYQPELPFTLPSALLAHPGLISAGAVLTLVLELGAPLALLGRRLGLVWAAGILAMHIGIAVAMGIVFPYQTTGLALLSFVALAWPIRGRTPRPQLPSTERQKASSAAA